MKITYKNNLSPDLALAYHEHSLWPILHSPSLTISKKAKTKTGDTKPKYGPNLSPIPCICIHEANRGRGMEGNNKTEKINALWNKQVVLFFPHVF